MKILLASSEVYPFSKTGGLADVAGALPEALVKLGHEVLVISPWYKTLKAKMPPLWIADEWVPFDGGIETCGVGVLEQNGVRYGFVGHGFFQRDTLYGFADDVKRFCFFTRAIPQVAARLGFVPDVVHANDWHTGYLPMVLQHGWHMPEGFVRKPSIFTIHNVQYQGNSSLAAPLSWLRLPEFLRDSFMNHFGTANAMQAGLGFAQRVTTVSPSYAKEIQTPAYGYGLDGTLRHISGKLSGIVNGIDTDLWNPQTDAYIPQVYGTKSLAKKQQNKYALCERFQLDSSKPLISVVSRLADQKGIDVFIDAVTELLWQDWTIFVLGSGEPALEAALEYLTKANPGRFASLIGYDESLAHLVYAGSDTLAIPSRFEPCGLTQLIAMRYGTIPIARATGGLIDTISHSETGFLFEHMNVSGLLWASRVARDAFENQGFWQQMMQNAMKQDFSWERSAKAYLDLYQSVAS